MPANQPADLHPLFQDAFNARDLDAILALYEETAVVVTGTAGPVTGHTAIRDFYQSVFGGKRVMRLDTASVLQNADLAMLEGRWVQMGMSSEGDPIQVTGTSREVVRRQTDSGIWKYAIDDPGTGR